MDTQAKKKTFPVISLESITLAKQARLEQQTKGYIEVKCPRCQEHPEISMSSKGERTIISCKCRYVRNAEINF